MIERRGFLGALVVLVAAPAAVLAGQPRRPRMRYGPMWHRRYRYRHQRGWELLSEDDRYFWKRRIQGRARNGGYITVPLTDWEPCTRSDFYGVPMRGRPYWHGQQPYRRVLPPNYKSPARIWWESLWRSE